jgi:hypothetical protein
MSTDLKSRLLWPSCPKDIGYTAANIFYVLAFVVSTAIAWVLREHGDGLAPLSSRFKMCGGGREEATRARCFRKEAVLRVACGTIFSVLLQLLLVLSARMRRSSDLVQQTCVAHCGTSTALQ